VSDRGATGAALVEVLVSCLLLATVAAAVMSAVLSASENIERVQALEDVQLNLTRLLEDIKSYVTAETGPLQNAPGDPPGSWHLPGDSCAACWALSEGRHDVSGRLDPQFKQKYGASLHYDVSVVEFNGLPTRRVEARLDWSMPR